MKLKTLTVKRLGCCARCGGNHRNLKFKELRRPIDADNFWAPCPKTGEPILMHQIISRYESRERAIQEEIRIGSRMIRELQATMLRLAVKAL